MLDSRRLKVLCEVARTGSFSAAAENLGYTQPAVSRQISTLEAEVGMLLVRRVPHGAVLTDAGQALVRRAELILAQMQDAEAELRALAGLEGGRLRLASFASAAASIVPPAVARFRDLYPAVEFSMVMADPGESIPLLRAGEIDLALAHDRWIAVADEPDAVGGVEYVHLFDDPMYVALPVGHPLSDHFPLRLADFAGDPWMLATTNTCPDSKLFLRACHEAGFEPRIALQNDDYPAILGFVAAGVGVALIPDMVTRGIRDDVVVRHLEPAAPSRPICAVVPIGYRSPAVAAMLDVLLEVGEEWLSARELLVGS
jgi:molybdate transport repressor ModE-like protein